MFCELSLIGSLFEMGDGVGEMNWFYRGSFLKGAFCGASSYQRGVTRARVEDEHANEKKKSV